MSPPPTSTSVEAGGVIAMELAKAVYATAVAMADADPMLTTTALLGALLGALASMPDAARQLERAIVSLQEARPMLANFREHVASPSPERPS